jgi:hypothetical protein
VPKSDGVPRSMRHLMNESNVPIYRSDPMAVSFLIDPPTNHVASATVPSPSSSLSILSNHDTELEHNSQRNGDTVTSDEDMAVELPSDSECNSSLHDSSFMSVDEELANTDIDSSSVDMEPVVPDSPPVLGMMEGSVMKEGPGPTRPESPKAGPTTKTSESKSIRKPVVDIFSQTKHRAVEALKNVKRVLDNSDESGDEKAGSKSKLKSPKKRPRKTPKTSTITE